MGKMAGVLVAVAALAGAVTLGLALFHRGSDSAADDGDTPGSNAPGEARAYSTQEEGCRSLRRGGQLDHDISKRVAFRDADRLSAKLVHDFDSRVMGLGASSCGENCILVAYVLSGHVAVPAHGPGGTPVIMLEMQDPRSPNYPSVSPPLEPGPFPHPPGTAGVYASMAEGCRDLLHPKPPDKRVSQQTATRDADYLARRLGKAGSALNMIGVSRCEDRWVVSVGVSAHTTRLPPRGPGGTPVIAFVQRGSHAF